MNFFMEVVDGIPLVKEEWGNLRKSFSARYASLTRQEEASIVLDRLRLESFRTAVGHDPSVLTVLVNKI